MQSQLANPQSNPLLQDSLQLINFHKKLLQLCTCAGVELVTLRDILAPTGKRTRHILSALINFCKFREDKMILFEECSNQTDALLAKRDALEKKLSQLTDNVNSIRLTRAEQQPQVQDLRKVTSVLAADLRDLKKNQTDLAQEMDALKLEKSKIAEKLTNNSFLITNLKQDCVRLQSRIVSDPAKLLQTIQEMSASVKTDKQNVVMAERKSRELKARLDAMAQVQGDLDMCKTLLLESDELCLGKKSGGKSVSVQKDVIGRKQHTLRDMQIKQQQHERQVKQASDKIARLAAHQQTRQETNTKRRDRLETEYNAAKQAFDDANSLKQDSMIETEQIYHDLAVFQTNVDAEVSGLHVSLGKLVSQVCGYQRELSLAMAPEDSNLVEGVQLLKI